MPRPARPRPLLHAILSCMGSAACCAQEATEPPINRPEAAGRIVRVFDFEPGPREIYDLPRYWEMARRGEAGAYGRIGFPTHNGGTLDSAVASAGIGSVRLDSTGGSACLRLETGVIPVFPATEYLISANVRTGGCRVSRVAVTARYLDQASLPIAGAERRSDLLISEGGWASVAVALPDSAPGAAFLQIDLEILQPEQFAGGTLGPHQVWPQDFPVSAWFDDVTVVQLPRARLTTNSPVNVVVAPERPRLDVVVRDFTGETLEATLIVQDASGKTLWEQRRPVEVGQLASDWEPELPGFGWYRACLDLSSKGVRVGSTSVDFAWVPAGAEATEAMLSERERFSIVVDELPDHPRGLLASFVDASGVGGVSLPAWNAGLTPESIAAHVRGLVPVLESLRAMETQVSFSLAPIPAQLALDIGAGHGRPTRVFAAEEEIWSPYLLPLLDKFGQRVRHWSVGSAGQMSDPADEAGLRRLESFLARLVPGPVVLPAAEITSVRSTQAPALCRVPFELRPETLREIARSGAGLERTLLLEPLPDSYAPADIGVDAAKRLVEAWAGLHETPEPDRQRIAVPAPWAWHDEHTAPSPSIRLPVLREAIRQLAGRRVVGEFPSDSGVTCYILEPVAGSGKSGALIAWASAPIESPEIRAYLGEGPITVRDLFGNERRVESSPGAGGTGGEAPPMHRIALSEAPVYIENVDVPLARFVAGFSLDPQTLPTTIAEHQINVRLVNPWTTRIEGRIAILEPGGLGDAAEGRDRSWTIRPRSAPFSIGPGQAAEVPISVMCSVVEEAGTKPFVAQVELVAERPYPPIRLRSSFELAADTIQLHLNYRYARESDDLILEAHITNKGAVAATMEVFAFAPGYPRAKASVSDLEPGGTVTRHFAFPDGVRLRGESIAVSVQDTQTRARITRSVDPD